MAAAATRVMVSASSNIGSSSSLLSKAAGFPLLRPHQSLSLCFKNYNATAASLVSSKRRSFFTCRALYKPEVLTKEEGLPEILDYRVFFLDNSGKKDSDKPKEDKDQRKTKIYSALFGLMNWGGKFPLRRCRFNLQPWRLNISPAIFHSNC